MKIALCLALAVAAAGCINKPAANPPANANVTPANGAMETPPGGHGGALSPGGGGSASGTPGGSMPHK